MRLMKRARQAIIDNKYPEFVGEFVKKQFPKTVPDWVREACKVIGVVV